MIKTLATALLLLILYAFIVLPAAQAQIVKDPEALATARLIMTDLYGYRFKSLPAYRAKLAPKYGQHPITPLSEALELYWRFFPLSCHAPQRADYISHLLKTVDLAEPMVKDGANQTNKIEGTFFQMMALMMLAKAESDNGNLISSLNYARKSYDGIKKGFIYQKEYPEFLFTSGLYNFYREYYPEQNPGYKPFMSFFANGNKELGKQQLRQAAEKSVFTKGEALLFLARIYSHADGDFKSALDATTELVDDYPANPVFNAYHINSLIEVEKYEEALKRAALYPETQNPFIKCITATYTGICYSRIKGTAAAQTRAKLEEAAQLAAACPNGMGNLGATALLELADIAKAGGDKAGAKGYAQRALALAQSGTLKKRAKQF